MTIIQTHGLTLRPIRLGDASRFTELCNDETLARNTSRIPFPYTSEHATAFVERAVNDFNRETEHRFTVCRAGEIIACTGLRKTAPNIFDLGYWVGKDARGNGVATKAASAIINFGFEQLRANTITAGYFIDNSASAHILEKLGFEKTGEINQVNSLARGCEVDTVQLVVTPSTFTPLASQMA